MGIFDRFKSSKEQIGLDKKPKHVVVKGAAKAAKEKAEDKKKKQFAAVPSAGAPETKDEKKEDAKPKTAEPKKQTVRRSEDTGSAYRVLIRTLVSEKATAQAANNQYSFVVAATSNKVEVGRAIQSLYGVRPQKINMLNYRGKQVRYGRTQGRTKGWKKAIVTLQPGQKLDTSRS
jgi:large subunit ribosomal protein L23